MTDPASATPVISYTSFLIQISGALLSMLGGFVALILRARMEKLQEIKYIKISIVDEIEEICGTIDKLKETYKQSNLVSNSYINSLDKNNESYNFHKQRLFIINNVQLRQEITAFYKFLNESLDEARNRVGSLGEKSESDQAHDKTINTFNEIVSKGSTLKDKLQKYKYYIFWFNK